MLVLFIYMVLWVTYKPYEITSFMLELFRFIESKFEIMVYDFVDYLLGRSI